MTETISCPYCNTAIPLSEVATAGARILCPRCGEMFPNRNRATANAPNPVALPNAAEPAASVPASAPASLSNRSLAGFVLGIMGIMAVVGLTFALWTQQQRRQHDQPYVPPILEVPQQRQVAPAELAGLRYLPSATNVIAAVHVAEALREPTGLEVLSHLRLSTIDLGVNSLPRWTGLSLDDIDHVVLGVHVDVLRLTLIVETRRPLDADKVRQTLKATKKVERGRKTIYRFNLNNSPLEPALWFAGEKVLVVALKAQDLDDVPLEPADQLITPLKELLTKRITTGTQVWFVGHAEDWSRTAGQLALQMLPKDVRDKVEKVQTFGLWLQCSRDIGLNAALHCTSEEAAQALADYLRQLIAEGKESRQRPEFNILSMELSRTLVQSRTDAWLDLQARMTVEALRQALAAGQ